MVEESAHKGFSGEIRISVTGTVAHDGCGRVCSEPCKGGSSGGDVVRLSVRDDEPAHTEEKHAAQKSAEIKMDGCKTSRHCKKTTNIVRDNWIRGWQWIR